MLAANLRRHRRAKGLSQEELAHRASIDRTYISALERCVYSASIDVLDSIAHELGIETAVLLTRPVQPTVKSTPRIPGKRVRKESS